MSSCALLRDSKIAELYHNVTSRFNGYFNAKQRILAVEDKMWETQQLNFNEILPLYPLPEKKLRTAYNKELDVIIQKCSDVLAKHGESNWADDCYLLIGKSYYYKGDYFAALEMLQYLYLDYKTTEPAYEALVEMLRAHLDNDKYNEAQAAITVIDAMRNFPEELKPELQVAKAQYAITQEDYKTAAVFLDSAYHEINGRERRIRYAYVLGQLYQKLDSQRQAADYYRTVIRKNPPYELAINARINLIDVGDDKDEVERLLLKLLRDDKNIQFADQIYYQLARVALQQGDRPKAKDYLRKSTAASKFNKNQKGESFILLANLEFEDKNYTVSKSLYDSASLAIDDTYPDYEAFQSKKKVLDKLIGNLKIITEQDSLQALGRLSEKELIERINELIEEDKQRAQAGVQDAQQYNAPQIQAPSILDDPVAGRGYFYNPQALQKGYVTFVQTYGKRPLVENWRRTEAIRASNIARQGSTAIPDVNDVVEDTLEAVQARYLAGVPRTPSLVSASNNLIQGALFDVSAIYQDDLNEYNIARYYYNELIQRFPTSPYTVKAYYNLYRLYRSKNQFDSSGYYGDLVLKKFPDTQEAALIRNPTAARKGASNTNPVIETAYKEAYQAYSNSDCQGIASAHTRAQSQPSKNYLEPRFRYLTLLCSYRGDSSAAFADTLVAFSKQYIGDAISVTAYNLAQAITNRRTEQLQQKRKDSLAKQQPDTNRLITPFVDNKEGKHFFLLIIPQDADANKLKTAFSNYHAAYFKQDNLQTTSFVYNDDDKFILVDKLETYDKAVEYYRKFVRNPSFSNSLDVARKQPLVISQQNFNVLMRDRALALYEKFFQKTYL